MLYPKPLNCICNNQPKLLSRSVSLDAPKTSTGKVYSYRCKTCDISTFHTKTEELCRELWNAAITVKLKNNKKYE